MNTIKTKIAMILICIAAGAIYGVAIHKYQLFPYQTIKNISKSITKSGTKYTDPWTIGIYKGPDPFNLAPSSDIKNPVLTPEDVTDMDAALVADPFITVDQGTYYMFFESYNKSTSQGDISFAKSTDGMSWTYQKTIIDEDFHLSYPYVFEWEGNYYLTPESHEDFSVRLYKAKKFPNEWEYTGTLLSGYKYLDPTIFRHNEKWWMFVATGDNNILNLYFSDDLQKNWEPHPMNPIVKLDKRYSRPGGRILSFENKLYRLTQDDDLDYGRQVFAFEIIELSETTYKEKLATKKPIVTASGKGWNATGMHHVDTIQIDDEWISSVDGRSENEKSRKNINKRKDK